jgi:hypothetical protein
MKARYYNEIPCTEECERDRKFKVRGTGVTDRRLAREKLE